MKSLTAFKGERKLAAGPPALVAVAVKQAMLESPEAAILAFRDDTGEQVDLDLRGNLADIEARYQPGAKPKAGPGRPKLGVTAREITLLPRHWDWLSKESGGASVALRRLVDEAMKAGGEFSNAQRSREASYRFISVLAGNLPSFEEATRALNEGNQTEFRELIATWPMDVQVYALYLSWEAW